MAVERVREIRGAALPVRGDDIDTDRIIPARFLKSVSFDGLEDHLFEDDRQQLAAHPVSNPAYRSATVMLVNANFGCGSSREHAPQAIRRRGIRAVIGQSFSEIFFGNSVVLGLPCPTASADTLNALMTVVERDPSTEIAIDLSALRVTANGTSYELSLPPAAREAFLEGSWDATGQLLERFGDVEAVAARLPYVSGTW
ncbi:MAG TPA: 3-isopropylmalate dehydratase small subunit [Vicinamibacterales bacterium]